MLRLFRRSSARRVTTAPRPTRRLRLEALEDRCCPAPVVSNLSVTQGTGHTIMVAGDVQDQYMGGMQINVSGVANGTGGINSDGSFNLMLNATAVGTITVTATDMMHQTSTPTKVSMLNYAPTLAADVDYLPQKQVRLFGQITDEVNTTVSIVFNGQVVGSVMAGSDGRFSFTATASALGDVQIHAVDQWGLESDTQTVTLTNSAPVISAYKVWYSSQVGWMVNATVTDECAAGLPVTIKDPNGTVIGTPEVNLDGYVQTQINLAPGLYGSVTAVTTDWWGLQSNTVWQIVST